MWSIIPSLDALLHALAVAFTEPSFQTHRDLFLGWIMCIGKRTEYRVFQTIHASSVVTRVEHHPFDRFYNFFSRSAWTVESLAHQVAVAIVLALNPTGPLYLVVDDTLLDRRGQKVYGLGWFRDAVASTAKRVATASGNNWVVMGLAMFTTDLGASLSWVVATFARRWSLEVVFKASKQVIGIAGPQHWCRECIERLAPWVWLMQSVVSLWYLTVGHAVPAAESARRNLGPWDTEWSLGHWVRILRAATMAATINPHSNENDDCRKLIERVKSYLFYVASTADVSDKSPE